MDKTTIIIILGAIAIWMFLSLGLINITSNERKQCEELNGVFYGGGFLSASNCVFPPK